MAARRSYGTGSLYVRADRHGRESWYGRWWADGQRFKRLIGPRRDAGSREGLTRKQAEARLRVLIADEKPVRRLKGDVLTIEDLGRRYLAHLRRYGRKRATVTAVESVLRVWLVPFFADRDLRRVRVEDVRDLIDMMETGARPGPRAKGDRRYGRPVGPKSVRNYVGTLSAMLTFAEEREWLTANVSRRVELPPAPQGDDIRFLEPVELEALASASVQGAYEHIDRALYLTAAMTGLRQGELIALRWRDVDWTAGRIRVRQNYVLGEFGTPKSRRSTRSVPMADRVAGDRLSKAAGDRGQHELVFADPHTGGPQDKAAILRRYRQALRAARLDASHRFHDLRHTFGTRMAGASVPMRTLQEWMGHRDIQTTQRYADYAPSPAEAALVAAAFGAGALAVASSPGALARARGVPPAVQV